MIFNDMKNFVLFLLFTHFSIHAQDYKKSYFSKTFTLASTVLNTSIKTIPSDFVYMRKNVSEDWKRSATYLGIVAGLMLFDKPITELYQQEIETRIDYKLPAFHFKIFDGSPVHWLRGNDAYMSYPSALLYLGSLLTGYEKGQYTAINSFKAVLYSTLITQVVLKTIIGRTRPFPDLENKTIVSSTNIDEKYFTDDPYDFFNSRGGKYILSSPRGSALPSLHATAFFAMAKVYQMEFDNYWIPYGFMAGVFLADIKSHRHWISDMVAGGIIGTVIGRSVVKSSWRARGILPNKEKSITINWTPSISTRYSGINLLATF